VLKKIDFFLVYISEFFAPVRLNQSPHFAVGVYQGGNLHIENFRFFVLFKRKEN
jgi:hypothetical protein